MGFVLWVMVIPWIWSKKRECYSEHLLLTNGAGVILANETTVAEMFNV